VQKEKYDSDLRAKLDAQQSATLSPLPSALPLTTAPSGSPAKAQAAPTAPGKGIPITEIVIAGVLLTIIGAAAYVDLNSNNKQPEKDVVKQNDNSTTPKPAPNPAPIPKPTPNPTTKPAPPIINPSPPVKPTPEVKKPMPAPTPPAPVSPPVSAAPEMKSGTLQMVKIVSAKYGAGNSQVDVTEKIRAAFAKDPYAPVQADDRAMGDPAHGQKKVLEVSYEIDGKLTTIPLGQEFHSTIPPLPPGGVPAEGGSQDFRIVAARYGAGLTWFDATEEARQMVIAPGQVVTWQAFTWNDPWSGVRKQTTIWFEHQGKRFVRVFNIGDRAALVDGAPAIKPASPFVATIKKEFWQRGMPKPVLLGFNTRSFAVVTELAGNFLGGGEAVWLSLNDKNQWQIGGHSDQELAGHAMSIATPFRDNFEAKTEEFLWKPGSKSVKMIHSSEGFCILSGAGGDYGGGEGVWVVISPTDGF